MSEGGPLKEHLVRTASDTPMWVFGKQFNHTLDGKDFSFIAVREFHSQWNVTHMASGKIVRRVDDQTLQACGGNEIQAAKMTLDRLRDELPAGRLVERLLAIEQSLKEAIPTKPAATTRARRP